MLEWFKPPPFDDPEENEQAAILWFTILLGLATCASQAVTYVLVPTMSSSWWYLLPESIAMVGALIGIRAGYLRLPAALLLSMFVALITAFVFFGGGLEYAFPPLLGVIAVMGALMLGWRAGAALTAWGLVATTGVYLFGSSTAMIIPGQDKDAILYTIQVVTVLLGGSLVTYSTYRLSLALRGEMDQKRAAEATLDRLEQARRYTADLVQSMAEGVVVVRMDGTVDQVNDAAVRLFAAATPDALLGQDVAALLGQDALRSLEASATPGATAFGEATLHVQVGRELRVRVARSQVTGEDGEGRYAFVLSDISVQVEARKRSAEAARAAEEANRAKSQFLANMSHELRTPLNAVIGYSDMLIDDIGEPDLVADVQRIRQAGQHLLALINDVLDMSRIEAGRMDVYADQVWLRELVSEVEAAVFPVADRRGNTVSVELNTDLPAVVTDGRKLRQILLNLMSNAVKFTENGDVRMRVSATPTTLEVEVEDTGIGIEPEAMARLFQPFVQADDSTSRRYGGTGLGLALSRRFAEMLDGSLTASSTPGEGSVFRLFLPVAEIAPSTPAPEVEAGQAPLVLCVDDDPDTLDLLGRVLRRQGFRVALAGNGRDALKIAREHQPAVITLDVMMPEMDGWTLLQRLREDPLLRDVPAVMVSMVDHNQAEALSLGAADYLVKPVEPDTFLRVMRRYLNTGQPGLVLVVDDEEDMRDLLRRLLVGEGWEVETAPNSRAALDRLGEVQPDLVVLDLMMPEMDGFAFVETVRRNDAFRDLPIVVLTAMELTRAEWTELASKTNQIVQKSGNGLLRVLEEVRRYAS
jgi:signal transduction histidine kinase/DNA-binding response OmpR family regulator